MNSLMKVVSPKSGPVQTAHPKKIIERKKQGEVSSQLLSPISSVQVLRAGNETPYLQSEQSKMTLDFLERQVAQSRRVTVKDFDHSRSSIYEKIKRNYMGDNSQKERHREVK